MYRQLIIAHKCYVSYVLDHVGQSRPLLEVVNKHSAGACLHLTCTLVAAVTPVITGSPVIHGRAASNRSWVWLCIRAAPSNAVGCLRYE